MLLLKPPVLMRSCSTYELHLQWKFGDTWCVTVKDMYLHIDPGLPQLHVAFLMLAIVYWPNYYLVSDEVLVPETRAYCTSTTTLLLEVFFEGGNPPSGSCELIITHPNTLNQIAIRLLTFLKNLPST